MQKNRFYTRCYEMRACFPAFQPEQKYLGVTKVNYFTVTIVYTW